MKPPLVDKIVEAVLYEGYLLYPYRPSVKNQQRWTFGGLFPEAYTQVHDSDGSTMQTECLVATGTHTVLAVKIRFLHLISRQVGKCLGHAGSQSSDEVPLFTIVPTLQIDGQLYHPWQEAMEREVDLGEMMLDELIEQSRSHTFNFPPQRGLELLRSSRGEIGGVLLREQQALAGVIEVRAASVGEGLVKVTVIICNQSPLDRPEQITRDQAQMQSLASTHTILGVREGGFVSLTDPPEQWQGAVSLCHNVGCWPVLVGEPGDRDTMLSSPIILYDYPQIAPESPGNLFDGTEVDEILSLRIMTLTEEEKQAMASIDERARQLLQRTEGLSAEQILGMHGTVRELRSEETN